MAEPKIKTTIEFPEEVYARFTAYADSHDVGFARAIDLLLDAVAPGKKFKPPTVEEVAAYCKEKGYTFDPETFVAYYEKWNWKLKGEPIKKWKSACVTWQKREQAGSVDRRTRSLVGKSVLPASPGPRRDPFASGVPAEVRAAAEKRRARQDWVEGQPKPESWKPAKFYGPDSRDGEEMRLGWWEDGDDDAFTRNRATYPSPAEVREFNKSMVGASAGRYYEVFKMTFGCEPEGI